MEIEKLVEEQKKTQEILLRLEKSGTFQKFFDGIQVEGYSYEDDPMFHADPWNYEELSWSRSVAMGDSVRAMYEAIRIIKYCLGYIDKLYEYRVRTVTSVKDFNCRGAKNRRKIYESYYANPICKTFFELYEADHPEVTPLETILEIGDKRIAPDKTRSRKNKGERQITDQEKEHHRREYLEKYYIEKREHLREYNKKYYIENKERIKMQRAKRKQILRRNKKVEEKYGL